jgi:hypothetical protein
MNVEQRPQCADMLGAERGRCIPGHMLGDLIELELIETRSEQLIDDEIFS